LSARTLLFCSQTGNPFLTPRKRRAVWAVFFAGLHCCPASLRPHWTLWLIETSRDSLILSTVGFIFLYIKVKIFKQKNQGVMTYSAKKIVKKRSLFLP
jgi:hypothetical protein